MNDSFFTPFILSQSHIIASSYFHHFGSHLLDDFDGHLTLSMGPIGQHDLQSIAKKLYKAPFAILSHDRMLVDGSPDNVYNYANKTALRLFERSFEEQTQIPSSASVGLHADNSPASEDRNALLRDCLCKGSIQFDAERQAQSGKLVLLRKAILFNLVDSRGIYRGQAVKFFPVENHDIEKNEAHNLRKL